MTDINARGFCPRCLLAQAAGGEALARQVGEWIDALPPARRAPDAAREARLDQCKRCGYLSGSACELCGCYVDFRAAQRGARCPDVPARWAALPPLPDEDHDWEEH